MRERALRWLRRRFGRYALPHLTLFLVAGQAVCYLIGMADGARLDPIALRADRVLAGEVWRLVTFLFYPPLSHPVFIVFALYLFYLMGTALEGRWGTFRYNIYILIAWGMTVAASFLVPHGVGTSAYIGGSVFLAFAWLYPDFVLHILFLFPVRIKWLALLTWIGYVFVLLAGPWVSKLLVLASVANFLLFFGDEILDRARASRRKMAGQARDIGRAGKAFHRCHACGVTEKDDPAVEFRVCSTCHGGLEYCEQHIRDHSHVPPPAADNSASGGLRHSQ